ncbi:unnamed protein product [Schistocephalus solidus]|uniref:Ubiquitin thioesterase OTU n=1 Tax=Schistocephalus solidus TaxID=70667 RepID=A0A3P7CCS0_SCHSO|nr:unnamed protein product [Schistocephalus solidus]
MWPAVRNWNLNYLTKNINGNIQFRMGRKGISVFQRECDALYISATVDDFAQWVNNSCQPNNPFIDYSCSEWWAYASYLHMPACPPLKSLIEDVPWSTLSPYFPKNSDSTFWLGTSGSHTACHYDTYGVNFVLQVLGQKRWILFPPSDTQFMYPTRIPLEESTVFSEVNFQQVDFINFPLVLNTSPTVVVLQPGDVLFVPRHWWHFVESIEGDGSVTCAVNLWLDQPSLDNEERCKESLTQLVCLSLMHSCKDKGIFQSLHVPERELALSSNWFETLKNAFRVNLHSSMSTVYNSEPPAKTFKHDSMDWAVPPTCDIIEILPELQKLNALPAADPFSIEKLLRAFTDPEVIDLSTVASKQSASLGAPVSGILLLRCKSPSGQLNIELSSDSTVGDLADKVCSLTDLTRRSLSLRYGYPLKRLDLGAENCSKLLTQVPIRNGESIVADSIEPRSASHAIPAASSVPATQPSIIRLIAPSDNCCLFTSVSTCVENENSLRSMDAPVVTNAEGVQETRNLIASFVQSYPETFNQGILGMAPEAYIQNIIRPDCWGGGIEVSILSQIYELEINVVDVLTGRIDRFGEDKAYQQRILLLYDGIHYDPLAMSYPDKGTVQTIFPTSLNSILDEARNLAVSVRKAGLFTDLTNCNLMCSVCRTPLKGQQGAQQHAASTGHTQFQERK